ncbi:MAG: hypothetical protein GX536_09205, partial [Actinobacteria bacterium]|nr:hypothetical protein [Actinomycetota bacterium]
MIFLLAVALVVGAVLCLSGCTRVIIQEPPNNEGEGTTTSSVGTTSTTARLETATSLTVITGPGSVSGQVSPAEAVAIVVGPSVVNVAVEGTRPGFGGRYQGEGSGVILTSEG